MVSKPRPTLGAERNREVTYRIILQLREVRKQRKISMEKVAELIGVQRSTVGSWENGRHLPTISMLNRYAEVLSQQLTAVPQTAVPPLYGVVTSVDELGAMLWLHVPCGTTLWFTPPDRSPQKQPRHCYVCRAGFPISTWIRLYRVIAHQ